MATHIDDGFVNDLVFQDDIVRLPGNYFITYGDIKKQREGESFTVICNDGEEREVTPPDDFWELYEFWENYHYFGLPHGNGWANEAQETIDLLKAFERAYEEIRGERGS